MRRELRGRSKWTAGLILLGVVIVLWVFSSFLISSIFEDGTYRKPYLITYINTGTFTFYLVPSLVRWYRKGGLSQFLLRLENKPRAISYSQIQSPLIVSTKWSTKSTSLLALQFCVLWYLANLLNNASLSYTSVTSQTILSSTSSFFTLLIASLVHVERFTLVKLGATITSFVGIVFIATSDFDGTAGSTHKNGNLVLLGNLMALGGAAFYGLYTSLLKVRVKDEKNVDMQVFFGFVGLFNMLLLWPTLVIFHFTGVEKFEMPPSGYVWKIVIINAFFTFISDFSWVLAMLLTSPLTVTLGLSLTFPLAMVWDMIINSNYGNFWYYVGAALIGISFVIIDNEGQKEAEELDSVPTELL